MSWMGYRHKYKLFSRSFGPRDTVMACNEASTTVYVGIWGRGSRQLEGVVRMGHSRKDGQERTNEFTTSI